MYGLPGPPRYAATAPISAAIAAQMNPDRIVIPRTVVGRPSPSRYGPISTATPAMRMTKIGASGGWYR